MMMSIESIGRAMERVPNLNAEIVQQIADKLGMKFTPEKHPSNPEKFPSDGGVSAGRGGKKNNANNTAKRSKDTEADITNNGKRNTQNYMKLPYNPQLTERAKELRKAGNMAEIVFWNQIKNKQFKGFDFDRQKIIGNYIVDFFCSNCNVVIEIDGSSHDDKVEYDAARDAYLEGLGLEVIHISDTDVLHNMSGVLDWLHGHSGFAQPDDTIDSYRNQPDVTGNY